MDHCEYLVSYGQAGEFGRFEIETGAELRRGDPVVVRSPRGQEIGKVMRAATAQQARLLAEKFLGQILRPATTGDLELAARLRRRSRHLFEDALRLVGELTLPLEILDAELLLDGRQAILHFLRWAECDPRPLMEPLAEKYHLLISLHDLALPTPEPEEHAACGAGGCGSSSGGCGSCSSGGCSSCSVGAKQLHAEMKALPAEALARVSLC